MAVKRFYVTFGPVANTSASISAMCHWQCHWCHVMAMPMALHVILHHNMIVLTLEMQWCHWWHHWQHVRPVLTPMVSQEPKSRVAPHFQSFWAKECSGATNIVMCHVMVVTNGHHMTKEVLLDLILVVLTKGMWLYNWHCWQWCLVSHDKSLLCLIWSSCIKEYSANINETVNIMWCWYLCQWHHITKKSDIAPHFNHPDLRNAMLLLTVPLVSTCCQYQCQWH